MSRLRDLDARLVPVAAARLRGLLDEAGRARAEAGRRARRAAALVREVPQLAVLVLALLFAGAAAVALATGGDDDAPAPSAEPAGATAELGVPAGADPEDHLAQAADDLRVLAEDRPQQRYLALVSLARYLPVTEVPVVLAGVDPVRGYLRAPGVEGAETVEVPLAGTTATAVLPALCTATAARKTQDAEELRRLAVSLQGSTTPEEQAQLVDYEAEAVRADAESAAFGPPCRAFAAAVVEAEAADLAALLDRGAVRGVEVAGGGLRLGDLQVIPLLPPDGTAS